jgi:hypothetical protein
MLDYEKNKQIKKTFKYSSSFVSLKIKKRGRGRPSKKKNIETEETFAENEVESESERISLEDEIEEMLDDAVVIKCVKEVENDKFEEILEIESELSESCDYVSESEEKSAEDFDEEAFLELIKLKGKRKRENLDCALQNFVE